MNVRLGWLVLLLAGPGGCSEAGGDRARLEILATVRGDPERGAAAIEKYGCGSCHVIPGVHRGRGLVGPPLTDFAQRTYIAGNAPNTPDNLVAWIRYPDSLEPGTAMPTLGVSEQEARDITAHLYLGTATTSQGPPRLLPASLLGKE